VLAEKAVLPPFGVCGGGAGAANRFRVRRDGVTLEPSPLPGKVGSFPLEPGDVVVIETSGGGGFGDPLTRELERVVADVAEGYVSNAAAARDYGVVIDQGGVDAAATGRTRDAVRAARIRVRLVAAAHLEPGAGRTIRLDAGTATKLGVTAGGIVEIVNPRGAPLRAWVELGRDAAVSPMALRMLGVAGTEIEVEIRAVHTGVLG
jgi:N-methylhydantoinase B